MEAMASFTPTALLLKPAALAAMIAPDHARSGERSTLISGGVNSGGRPNPDSSTGGKLPAAFASVSKEPLNAPK